MLDSWIPDCGLCCVSDTSLPTGYSILTPGGSFLDTDGPASSQLKANHTQLHVSVQTGYRWKEKPMWGFVCVTIILYTFIQIFPVIPRLHMQHIPPTVCGSLVLASTLDSVSVWNTKQMMSSGNISDRRLVKKRISTLLQQSHFKLATTKTTCKQCSNATGLERLQDLRGDLYLTCTQKTVCVFEALPL